MKLVARLLEGTEPTTRRPFVQAAVFLEGHGHRPAPAKASPPRRGGGARARAAALRDLQDLRRLFGMTEGNELPVELD